MNRDVFRPLLPILAALTALSPLAAQDPPPPATESDPPAAAEAVTPSEIKLNGIWGVEIGGRYTGVDVEFRQLSNVFRATYAKLPPGNPLGIRPGFDFCNGTLQGNFGRGIIQIRRKPKEGDGPPEKSTAPIILRVSEDHNRLTVRIEKEDMKAAEREIELVRPGTISNLRLYAAAPGGAQATSEILENVPMMVDVQVDSGALRPVEVTVKSGNAEVKLTARPWENEEGGTANSLRTEPFLPTFGGQLGVEAPEPEEEEPIGREATGEDFQQLVGIWKTVYNDAVLGNITGWVHVSEFGQTRLNYEDPKGGGLKELKLTAARVDGELPAVAATDAQPAMEALPKLVLEFGGEGVRSDRIEPLPEDQYPTLLLDPARPQPITLSAKDVTAEVPLRFRELPDRGIVNLTLESRERPDLVVWKWNYLASRATNRDGDGYGRVGVMLRASGREESTLGEMTGREAWMRRPPQIVAAFSLNNQLALEADRAHVDGPVAEYRHAHLRDKEGLELLPRSGNLTRTVFVVANNLPPADAGDLTLKIGEGSGVEEYRIQARGTADDPAASEDLKKGWEQYRRMAPANSSDGETRSETSVVLREETSGTDSAAAPPVEPAKEEGLVLMAIIKSGADPGPQPLLLNDAEGAWDLLYGDTTGTLSIARQLAASTAASADYEAESGEWEPTAVAFSPERLHIIVQVPHRIESADTIHAVLRVKREFVEYKGDKKIPLTPDPNDPKIYLSPPIEIVREADYERLKDQPDAIVIPHKVGTTLQASASRDSGYAIGPAMFETKVLANPARLNRLWKDAVKRAADLAGQPIEDWNGVARGEAGNATNFIITDFVFNQSIAPVGNFLSNIQEVTSYVSGSNVEIPMVRWWKSQSQSNAPVRSLKISIGDHAAMLLLRAEFVKMMQEQVRDWESNQNSTAMLRIFEAQKKIISKKQSPLSYIRIPVKSLPGYTEGAQSRWDSIRLFFGEEENPFLWQLFDNNVLYNDLRIPESDAMFERIQWEAFRWAYREWGPKMRASISEALNTPDSDVLGLMKLTGNGFESVVPRLLPMLLKLEDDENEANRSRWVPDRVARAYVKSLGVLGAAVRAQEDLSEIDKTVVVTTAALASVALGNVGGIWSAWAALAISVADLSYAVYTDLYRNSLNEDQLEFEIGAGAILGTDRVAETESKVLAGWQQALSIGGSLLGVGADTAVAYRALKAARAMDAAEVANAATEIMKRVDVADPAALRTLSKADQAILARYVEDAEALAAAGRAQELGEQGTDALRARNAIRDALESGENLAERSRLLDEAVESPALNLNRADLDDAAKRLDDLIEARTRQVDELKAKPKPPEGSEEARQLGRQITDLKDEIGDLSQRRHVLNTFREPKVKVPEDVARVLNGEADELTEAGRRGLKETHNQIRDRGASRAAGLQEVNLSAARRRLEDLGKAAEEQIDALKKAENPDPNAIKAAERRADDLAETHANVELMEEALAKQTRVKLSLGDVELLQGKRLNLDDLDHAMVEDAIVRSGHDWGDLSKAAGGDGHDQLLMHKVAQYRRNLVNKIADEAIAEVEAVTGQKLGREAFGSTNLSSDYDAAIKGAGAEQVVRKFNDKIRRVFGGRESGNVVDTNLYTDPVYNVYKAADLVGGEGKVSRAQLDTARQFLFQQMANAKYRSPEQWAKYRKTLLDGVPPQSREAIGDLLDQARGANDLAKGRIAKRLEALAESNPLPTDPKAAEAALAKRNLAVTNDLYADTLDQIHNYRKFAEHLDEVKAGKAAAGGAPIPPVLQNSELGSTLSKIDKLLGSSDPNLVRQGQEALDNLKNRAVLNMRSKQGEALYYAAEAYQTRGTIAHVVGELQAGGKKVSAADILSGTRRQTELRPDDYVNSFYENGANLIKELDGKKVINEVGDIVNVPGYMEKAATKGAKYFVRQIDAAHMAGANIGKSGIPDVDDLVKATVELDGARGDMAKFKDVLKKYGWTGEDYLKRVLAANEALEGKVLGNGSLTGFAADLHTAERAAERLATPLSSTAPANGLFTVPKAYQASDNANRLRNDFESQEGVRLATLNQAARTGRHLTDAQQEERENLSRTAEAQNALDRSVAMARISGLSPADIDRALSSLPASDDPALLRHAAAENLMTKARNKLPTRTSWRGENGESPVGTIPEGTRTSLGLDASPPANASALATSLRNSGQHVQHPETPLAPDILTSHLQGGRKVLALIENGAGEGPSWVRVHRIDGGIIQADDPLTGQPMDYPADLFEALSAKQSDLLIIDPYRSAEGQLRTPPERDSDLPDLDEVFPLPAQQ